MTANRAAPAAPPRTARKGDPSLSILVVDDESDLREMLTRSFAREGHRVVAVPDGRTAVEHAGAEHFDIVLLDVALGPGPDGYEVCRTLRSRRNVVPIIMLTALDSEADAVLGLEAGADDYVTKPFGLAELRSRIRAVLRRAGTRALGAVLGPAVATLIVAAIALLGPLENSLRNAAMKTLQADLHGVVGSFAGLDYPRLPVSHDARSDLLKAQQQLGERIGAIAAVL